MAMKKKKKQKKTEVDNAKQNIIMGCFEELIVDLCFRVVCCFGKQIKKVVTWATRNCKSEAQII